MAHHRRSGVFGCVALSRQSGKLLLIVALLCAGYASFARFTARISPLVESASTDSALRATRMGELIGQLPRLAEVYERKIALAVNEVGLSAEAVEASPTLLAVRGVIALHSGDTTIARHYAGRLRALSQQRGEGLFFPFLWDYETVWPYRLKAPWISALTQGFALALFDGLARKDGRADDQQTALAVARSFLLPIEKGGVLRETDSGAVFEEYPLPVSTLVLNGAALATLALVDYTAYTPDAALAAVLERCKMWWRSNIDRFTVYSTAYPVPVSAYSLAPVRKEVLFRFLHDGTANIDKITLIGANGQIKILDVGGPEDARRSGESFVWFNQKFQNWGDRSVREERDFRPLIPKQGEYNHSPFSFSVSKGDLQGPLKLEIQTIGEGDLPIAVQVFDGVEYHSVSEIAPGHEDTRIVMDVPAAAIDRLATSEISHPPVEPAYFYENMLYVRLLGKALNLKYLVEVSDRWKPSAELTPAQFDAGRTVSLLQASNSSPVLSVRADSIESLHTEYPSVIRYGDGLVIFYAAIGVDRRWRLFMATSSDDGQSWVRQGGPIADDVQPQKGAAAFPAIVHDEQAKLYRLFWSVDMNGDGTYDTILSAESESMWNWRMTSLRLAAQGLGLKVRREVGEWSMSYSESVGNNTFLLLSRRSADALSWSAATSRAVEKGAGQSGLYTHARLDVGGHRLWVIDRLLARDRIEWQLLCEMPEQNRLVPALDGPLHVSDPGADRWDQHRYGMDILEQKGRPNWFTVYYNGIRTDRGDGNGMIGRAEWHLDQTTLATMSTRCPQIQ